MNNFVFNSVANELKTSVYAQSPDTSLKSLQLDNLDRLLVGGNVTIDNNSLTVNGAVSVDSVNSPVTVSSITNPIMVGNSSLTVSGNVSVSSIGGPITIGNDTLNTIVAGSVFSYNSIRNMEITGSGSIFDDTDISNMKTATMFIYNEGTSTITLSLQMSPSVEEEYYINDPTYTDFTLSAGQSKIVTVSLFANYTRLVYNMGASTGIITAFFNGQT